jgi:uncharacterized protein YjbI with pentapeptide repeats
MDQRSTRDARRRRGVILPAGQRLVLFTLFVLLLAAFNVLLPPLNGEPSGSGFRSQAWGIGRLGFMLGQPALLGLWAALGPQRLAVRLPGALLLALLFAYTMLLAEIWTGDGFARAESLWETPILGVGLFVVVQLPFWALRRWRGWRLQLADSNEDRVADDRRFGLLLLLAWITMASVVFALWRALPVYDYGAQPNLKEVFRMLLVFGVPGLPVIPLTAAFLSGRGRWKFGVLVFILALVCPLPAFAAIYAIAPAPVDPNDVWQFYVLELGMLLPAGLTLGLARATGWRLVRPRARTTDAAWMATAGRHSVRFGVLLAAITVLAVLLGYLTVLREPTRQTLIVKSRWSRVGMFPTRNRGNTITGLTVQGTVITDEQVAAILAGAGQLESLYLNGCSFTEEQFARLTTLNSLENLGLATTNLTPSMLSHLKKLPKLRSLELTGATIDDAHLAEIGNLLGLEQLNLTGTNITDAGLVELEPLQNLTWLMLPTLSVTPGGTERLQQALPKANIIGPMALQTLPADPSQQNFEEAAETSESP